MTPRKLLAILAGIAAGLLLSPPVAHAQQWPSRPVRIICPIAAGGGIDTTARIVAARLSEIWSTQVVVENRTGASGNIAAEYVAHADPDGYTIYIATFPHATNVFLYPSLNYDPIDSFAPVILIATYPNMMVVPMSSPAHSVAEFIAYAKTRLVTFASSGHGSSLHLAGELFKRQAGIEMTHVPYRGASPALSDLLPGRIDTMFNFTTSSLPLVHGGQLRALATTTAKRVAAAQDVPTMAEAGVTGVEVSSWSAFLVPAKTPPDIIAKIHDDTVAVLAEPAVRSKLEDGGAIIHASTPAELTAFMRGELDKWGAVIKAANIKAE
jgi:tripartite-type tricarboxylate transporter receptor subunit TctC